MENQALTAMEVELEQLTEEKRAREANRKAYAEELRKCHCDFVIKEKIVRAGNSKIFQNWHEYTGIDMETFIDGLRWLCDDPLPEGKLSRELGSTTKAPYIVKLERQYGLEGLCAFYEQDTHRLWSGSGLSKDGLSLGHVSISAKDRI